MDIIVGTAGHIDHGKTALVKALTGTDTDRLPEEKHRGITIDLGFAELDLGNTRIGFVDVPGHERFVKNMLAGASGIDLVLLVVAADEGIMPQTREHFDICRLLQIKNGLIAITKSDLVDAEMLELVKTEIAEFVSGTFLEGSAMVPVSAKTGDGLDELRSELASTAADVKPRSDLHIARLPIDRSFAMKGFGSVVTGTLASGTITEGDEVILQPVGRRVRVRGVQSHGRKVTEARAGRRTAVNLAGIDHHDVVRGMLLAEPSVVSPEPSYDAEIEVLSDSSVGLKTRQRVRVHIGTAEVLARVVIIQGQLIQPGEKGFVQLRFESPVAAILGERFIIRSYSPQVTIAGGSILRPSRERVRQRNADAYRRLLSKLEASITDSTAVATVLVEDSDVSGLTASEIRAITGWTNETLQDTVKECIDKGMFIYADGIYIAQNSFDRLKQRVLEYIDQTLQKNRLSADTSLEAIRNEVFGSIRPEIEKAVIGSLQTSGQIVIKGEAVGLAGREAQFSEEESKALSIIGERFKAAGLEAPRAADVVSETAVMLGLQIQVVDALFQRLVKSHEIVRISPDLYLWARALTDLTQKVREFADRSADRLIDVPKFKEIAGVSRKYAIPLLEYFDQCKITARRGDKRLVI